MLGQLQLAPWSESISAERKHNAGPNVNDMQTCVQGRAITPGNNNIGDSQQSQHIVFRAGIHNLSARGPM